MSYAGANKPIAPISDPYQMYEKLCGQMKDKENLQSVLETFGKAALCDGGPLRLG